MDGNSVVFDVTGWHEMTRIDVSDIRARHGMALAATIDYLFALSGLLLHGALSRRKNVRIFCSVARGAVRRLLS